MKIIVTTSDKYHHLLRIFVYLFNKNWGEQQEVEIVGYQTPNFELPRNFTFTSLGKQGEVSEFSTDLREYFKKQDKWFIWMFDDTFVKRVHFEKLHLLNSLQNDNVGRINLSRETVKQDHIFYTEYLGQKVFENTQTANYRLSTQPSIWNCDFLLQYLTPGLSPWEFEKQESINDNWSILGLEDAAVEHNEGVCKKNIYDYDLNGVEVEQISEMKQLGIL